MKEKFWEHQDLGAGGMSKAYDEDQKQPDQLDRSAVTVTKEGKLPDSSWS